LLFTGIILAIPLVAMQFTEEVDWGLFDFLIGGILLFSTFLLLNFAFQKFKKSNYRWMIVIGIILTFILVWAELAVGIFGSPFAGS